MKTLILWLWAFGFAIAKTIWENNPEKIFYSYDVNKEILAVTKKTRKHPYFFNWYTLPENIKLLENIDDLETYDLLIITIPAQFISSFISDIKSKLKENIIILNLAKWIDNKSLKTIWDIIKENIWEKIYNYAVLSGWMIASELVKWFPLWADLWVKDELIWKQLKDLLENENLKIEIRKDVKNIELYGSLKNVIAIILGYYEWKWYKESSLWKYLIEYFEELKEILWLFWAKMEIDFSYYSFIWDIIASSFWEGRNRYFWKLIWSGKSLWDALEKLKKENKHAEWYETLKAINWIIKWKPWFKMTKMILEKLEIDI